MSEENIKVEYVGIDLLKPAEYNPRTHTKDQADQLKESIKRFGFVDPIICNRAPGRENVIVGGHFRWAMAKELLFTQAPVVFVNITSLEKEKELNLRLNKNTGDFDYSLLAEYDESFLKDVGFTSNDLDKIFEVEDNPEQFDLDAELQKLDIDKIEIKKGDIYELDGSRMMVGDSTIEADMLKLMEGHRADFCFTDPPYLLDYLKGKKKAGDAVTGFGNKRDRRYLETDVLPGDFTEKWMANVAKVQKPDFSIIVFENPKNLRTIWNELEKHWRYRNTITWHVTNRMQGFSAKYKFFNKTDIALVGTGGEVGLNLDPEEPLFQNEYENAIFATLGKPHWESYQKGSKNCPTDFIEHIAADKKSSGQEIIFGTKPLELLTPYIKVLTKRNDLVLEPFLGSGSTLIASIKIGRRCFGMEKSPVYAEIIRRRWELQTGKKAVKIYGTE